MGKTKMMIKFSILKFTLAFVVLSLIFSLAESQIPKQIITVQYDKSLSFGTNAKGEIFNKNEKMDFLKVQLDKVQFSGVDKSDKKTDKIIKYGNKTWKISERRTKKQNETKTEILMECENLSITLADEKGAMTLVIDNSEKISEEFKSWTIEYYFNYTPFM